MQPLATSGYSSGQVLAALLAHRYETFRYEVHRITGGYWAVVADATPLVHSCVIHYDRWARNFMRSASFEIVDPDGVINFLTDALRCFWGVRMPDGGIAEYDVGTFHIPSPTTELKALSVRKVEAQDALRNLADSRITDTFQIPSPPPSGGFDDGDPVRWAIHLIESRYPLAGISIPDTAIRVPATAPKTYLPGTPIGDVVNDLLLYVNYDQLVANVTGSYVSQPFVAPSARPLEFTYVADNKSIIVTGSGTAEQDLWNAPNQWLRIVSRPNMAPLRSRLTLDDPTNPLSTTYRGRTVTDFATIDTVDQATLDTIVQRLFEEGQRVAKKTTISTPLMPHDHQDKVAIAWITQPWGPDGTGVYTLRRWTLPMVAGGRMTQEYELCPSGAVTITGTTGPGAGG